MTDLEKHLAKEIERMNEESERQALNVVDKMSALINRVTFLEKLIRQHGLGYLLD